MAGYVRQSSANISSGQPITSAPVNNEFNQLQSAFSGTSGHPHDGGTGNGPILLSNSFNISTSTAGLIAATGSGGSPAGTLVAVTITGTSGKITVTNGTGASGNPTITIDSGYVGQTSITTLGTIATGVWQGTTVAVLYGGTGTTTSTGTGSVVLSASPTFTGMVSGAALSFSGNGSFTGTLHSGGIASFGSNITVAGTLGVTGTSSLSGNTTIGGTLGVTGATTLAALSSTGINSSPIGQSSAAAGSFTTLSASSTVSGSGFTTLFTTNFASPSPIGSSSPSTGAFTTLSASGTLSVTGTSHFTGNVGIGTTAGTYALSVVQAGSNQLYVGSTGSNASNIYIDAPSGHASVLNFTTAGSASWQIFKDNSGLLHIQDSVSGNYILTAAEGGNTTLGQAQNFIIDSSGNTATIGAVTATYNGFGLAIVGSVSSNATGVSINNTAGHQYLIGSFGSSTAGLPNAFAVFDQTSGGTTFILDSSGYGYLPRVSPPLNDSSDKIATTAFVNPANSIAANGFQQLSSGLIIQWGSVQQNANAITAVTFPTAFPNNVFSITATVQGDTTTSSDADLGAVKTNTIIKSGFTLVYCDDVNNVWTSWIAIGN